jgi:hypothetical protein
MTLFMVLGSLIGWLGLSRCSYFISCLCSYDDRFASACTTAFKLHFAKRATFAKHRTLAYFRLPEVIACYAALPPGK